MEIKEVEIENERVYLKKDWTGWRTVEPIIEPTTKKFIWKNFLSKKGFLTLGYIIILLLVLWLAFREQLANYHEVVSNPCKYCLDCVTQQSSINLTNIYLK